MSKRVRIPTTEHPSIVRRLRAGETLAQVAATYGCSHQCIHQIATRVDPEATAAGRAARKAQRVADRAAERAQRLAVKGPCVICWNPITTAANTITCGPRCSMLWKIVRLQLSEGRYWTHRRAHANGVLQRVPEPWPGAHRWARSVLDEQRPPNRRYVSPSSAVATALKEVERLRRAATRGVDDLAMTGLESAPRPREFATSGGGSTGAFR